MAAMLAGRPDAARLARQLPDNPAAQLVLADREAKAGHWDAAETGFPRLPQQGLTQVLRPLLIAWAQQGEGRRMPRSARSRRSSRARASAAFTRCMRP